MPVEYETDMDSLVVLDVVQERKMVTRLLCVISRYPLLADWATSDGLKTGLFSLLGERYFSCSCQPQLHYD